MTPQDSRNSRLLGNLADLCDVTWPSRREVCEVLVELERLAAREAGLEGPEAEDDD